MSTVKASNFQNASSSTVNLSLDASGNITAGANATVTGTIVMGSSFLRNRIINGDMRIDQRNAGASVTPTDTVSSVYNIDRFSARISQASKFSVQQNAGSVTPPAGFTNYLGVTSLSAYTLLAADFFAVQQFIEGNNVSDLAWGTANAQPVTLSFWVYSSLTGTFSGALKNSANNRSYPFTYSINAANTWEQKTITVLGDTTGTWLTTTGIGIRVLFSLGTGTTFSGPAGSWAATNYNAATGTVSVVGTNAATWYVTGVQLEAGSLATPFERRQYGQELALCQRYYEVQRFITQSTVVNSNTTWMVEKRTIPTLSVTVDSGTGIAVSALVVNGWRQSVAHSAVSGAFIYASSEL